MAVATVSGCTLLALLAWAAGPSALASSLRWAVAGSLGMVTAAVAASLMDVKPVSVRWDGRDWHLGPPDSAGHEATAGALRVSVDLGAWMLLRFDAVSAGAVVRPVWLPAQRRGLETQWHSLRCTIHSPKAALDPAAAAES